MATTEKNENIFVEMLWKNWDMGLQTALKAQQNLDKITEDLLKKQEDVIPTLNSNFSTMQNELDALYTNTNKILQEHVESLESDELSTLYHSWNESIKNMVNVYKDQTGISYNDQINKINEFYEKLSQATTNFVEEKKKWRSETTHVVEDFALKIKESQQAIYSILEENLEAAIKHSNLK